MKIRSMLQVLSQENEKKKKKKKSRVKNDSLHICVMVEGVFIWGTSGC